MSGPRIGALFAGYGGLDLAVQSVLGGSLTWVSEFDKGANKILAHRFPDVPNHGDITKIDWSQVEPVDILTGGSPCQDLSHAGKRSGMTEGTRSNLWVAMREAIAQLRPGLVVWENVRGAYSACADSEMGRCSRCVDPDAPGGHNPWLRALGRVLGDLSDLGYDAQWHGLRAADVGAPHGRFRVFVVAHTHSGGQQGVRRLDPIRRDLDGRGCEDVVRHGEERQTLAGPAGQSPAPQALLGTPASLVIPGGGQGERLIESARRGQLEAQVTLLPKAQRLLATPTASVATGGPPQDSRGKRDLRLDIRSEWGQYADAIARWEDITRPAPAPTQPSKKGTPQLSAAFSEWMMGLPAGWVTDVPGITRNEALKALGNGVVPQQCEAALRFLLGAQAVAA